MRNSRRFENSGIRRLGGLVVALAMMGAASVWGVATVTTAAPAPQAPVMQYSPGVAEILKMIQAKVNVEVIKAYIKNSQVPYALSSADIIALEQNGVPDDIITAVLQRGGEVRAQARAGMANATAQPYPAPNPYATTPAYPTTNPYATTTTNPGYDYGAVSSYPDYSYDYPAYDYGYGYPYYYGYGYPGWGWGGYWPFYFGFGYGHGHYGYGHYGYGRGGFGGRVGGFGGRVGGFGGRAAGGFHGGFSGGFHGGGGGHGGGGHR